MLNLLGGEMNIGEKGNPERRIERDSAQLRISGKNTKQEPQNGILRMPELFGPRLSRAHRNRKSGGPMNFYII
jgi:hypothetical protein